MPPKLHIISFDVPAPPDYGGAIDVYYKVKSLAAADCEIYLHCFQYGRPVAPELEQYCKEVWYYPRKTGIKGISLTLPYIVYSRRNSTLLKRLQQIDAPILFEGIHTTYYLSHPSLKNRVKLVRNQNVEYDYYLQLYKKATKLLSKIYFSVETALLYRYERHLKDAQVFLTVSQTDYQHFKKLYPKAQHAWIPSFHQYSKVDSLPGSGRYCLYHGNLGHQENIEAALFLLKEVFPFIKMPVIITGKDPDASIVEACKQLPNCTLIANPPAEKMQELIAQAHIHVLPTFQPTGIKLKLLLALFKGRHIVTNNAMLHGTGMESVCQIANSADEFINKINELVTVPFTDANKKERADELMKHYYSSNNAQRLITCLQPKSL